MRQQIRHKSQSELMLSILKLFSSGRPTTFYNTVVNRTLLSLLTFPCIVATHFGEYSSPCAPALAYPRNQNKPTWKKRRLDSSGIRQNRDTLFSIEHVIPGLEISANNTEKVTSSPFFPAAQTEIPVMYTNEKRVVERWLSDHVCYDDAGGPSSSAVLGFDVESVPNAPWIRKGAFDGPATVQLSTPNASLVAHLTRQRGQRRSQICPAIGAVLQDETIIKAGAGIDDDMLELFRWNRALDSTSRFDLGGIGNRGSGRRVGLKKLVQTVLGVEMIKSKKLSVSDWSRNPLSNEQIAYCARDAWASAAVLEVLGTMDPSNFGNVAIRRLAENERPMKEINSRAKNRKRARLALKALIENENYDCDRKDESLQSEFEQELKSLRRVLKELSPDGMASFDVAPLGFDIES